MVIRTSLLGALGASAIALAACNSNPLGLRPGATSVLDFAREPSPSEAVDMALDKYNADRRYKGTLLLAKQRFASEQVYVDLFVQRATDTDPGVRAAATRALGLHGRPEHAPLLVERLTDADPAVREEAARALQRIHEPSAIDALLLAMDRTREPEAAVRVEAARALGQYPQPRVLEKLIAALADDSLSVNFATVFSLRTLTGQDFGFDRAGWQGWYNATTDYFAARSAYLYPSFQRDKRWYEYIPMVPQPSNEPSGLPVGVSPDMSQGR
ncbi:hypothetical protein PHYC_01193 [Phycisphaerales bacterium]|nr:hypothetical protein PHYC_01193 [Phycisphaerales bacterium]